MNLCIYDFHVGSKKPPTSRFGCFLGRLGGVLEHDGDVLGRLWGASWGTLLHMGARAGPPLRQKTFAIVGNENCWKTHAPKAKILEIMQEFVYL